MGKEAIAMVVMAVVLFAGESIDGLWPLAIIDAVIIAALIAESVRLDRPEETARQTAPKASDIS